MADKSKLAPPISHKKILKYIGMIGFVLPLVLIVVNIVAFEHCETVLPTISHYYHSGLGDYFVASLAAIAFCLFAYEGYEQVDNILSTVAAIALFGVAIFPTWICPPANPCIAIELDSNGNVLRFSNAATEGIGQLHYYCAIIFFVILAYFCLFLFPKGTKPYTKRKEKVNRYYKIAWTSPP